jgi:hypothetical protein
MRDLGTNDGTGTSKQDNGILNEMKALRCHKKIKLWRNSPFSTSVTKCAAPPPIN